MGIGETPTKLTNSQQKHISIFAKDLSFTIKTAKLKLRLKIKFSRILTPVLFMKLQIPSSGDEKLKKSGRKMTVEHGTRPEAGKL